MKHFRVPTIAGLILFAILFAPSAFPQAVPEPSGWYAGDMHVHRSCGGSPESVSSMFSRMTPQNLSVVSQLADSGNGEVQNPTTDLPLVNGQDDPISTPGHLLHWDAEWHWDATYDQYPHQALGGHIVTLGLSSAQQLWYEYTFPILDWAHQHNGIAGFAHLQYLDGTGLPSSLTCCTPIEYPVEVALGAADFISEDVDDVNQPGTGVTMYSEPPIQAYYKLLNSGFRPGFAAGTDYPCNGGDNGGALGGLLTYVQVAGGQLTYRNWIQGISNGRTVVSRNGHNEFLNLTVNGTAMPGDEIKMANAGNVTVTVQWTATQSLSGTIELVQNGVVVGSNQTTAAPGAPGSLTATVNFAKSGWLAARRMGTVQGTYEHYVHTAAVFVTVNNAPIRASATDAQYYVNWTNGLLQNTSPGGSWNSFFPTSLVAAQTRYQNAGALFQQIASEAAGSGPTLTSIAVTPSNQSFGTGAIQQFTATGTYSNNTTLNITAQTRWVSSNTTVATINLRGSANALNPGTATISASLGSVTGSTVLTVQTSPLVITTNSLLSGTIGVPYSAALAASGGTLPYTWSISSGSLPAGLALNSSTGAISGMPTTAGTFNFTALVTDSGSPRLTATGSLSIVVANLPVVSCPCTIWPGTSLPGTPDSGPDSAVEVGVKFHTDRPGYINGIRFYKGTGNTGTHVGNLWTVTGTRLGTVTFTGETSSGWQQASFSAPVAIAANTDYVASYFAPNGHYADDLGYFATAGVNNAPLYALLDGGDGSNGVYSYGSTSSFPASGWQSSNYWVDVVFTTTTAPDTTPPSVVSVNPATAATGVSTTTSVLVTFSEAINPTTISVSTFQLFAPGNTLVPATVAYSSGSFVATLMPTAALATSTSYTALVTGGSSGVKDLAGNAMTGNFSWSFTTAAAPPPPGSCPCSIWSPTALPAEVDGGDPSAVELGVKFRSDVAGTITGLRFYKAATNTGTHIANLWTSTGTLLATANSSQESASGWQAVSFGTPVSIAASTTYVASYFAPGGHYSDSPNYFIGAGTDNAPLHALQTGVDGGNGVYNYGSASAFPTLTWQGSNYWVDVVFTPTSSTTPPTVNAVTPANNSSGAGLGPTVTATFSEPMTASTINATNVLLLDPSSSPVPATIAYDAATSTATLTPTVELSALTAYTATIRGGSTGVKDFNGNALVSDYSWSFTTGTAPANVGPGGPILVISSVLNPFSRYYGEILSAEGLNEYTLADISTITPTVLASYGVVILGDISLATPQVNMLTNWVNAGGNLIAMHPDKQLAGLMGLAATSSTLSDAYLLVQNSSGPGTGIVGQTMQFHGSADLYTLNGATAVATLYSSGSTPTPFPAVVLADAGAGQAATFTYDLARSIIYTRQGNPAWSGEARDGQSGPIRSDDLYFGAATFDPEPDWVNLAKVSIPQADEQQRLLANLILQMEMGNGPLPRFWYFPSGFKAVVVMTGDDHGSFYSGSATSQRFNDDLAASPSGCSVPDWQCVRATAYLFPQSLATNSLTDSQVAAYTAQGFEVSVHVDSDPTCSNWTASDLDSLYTSLLASLAAQFPSLPAPKTHRMHCIGWSDYDSQPQVELKHGIRLDTTYYYWPPTWVNDQPGMFTGSGMPMRYTDRNGNIIDAYQAATQMTDESGQSYPDTIDSLLDNALGTTGYYGAFVVNAHNDQGSYPGIAPDILDSAQSHGVPIVSALQMLTWLDGRNSSSFGSLAWAGNTLTFNILQGTGARNLLAMLPMTGPTGTLSTITLSGSPVSFTTQTIKGISYAMFSAASGSYQAAYGGSPAVVLSSVSLNPVSVTGGTSSTGTVTLSGPAPTGGAVVTLSSSNTGVAQVAVSSVTVTAGSTTAAFSVTTSTVASSTQVTISGTYPAGTTRTATLTVTQAVVLSSVSLSPSSVIGGNSSTGTVTLSGPAPTGGVLVTLSSSNTAAATVPASATVPAGSTSTTFSVTTSPVAAIATSVIGATYGASASASLTVNPPAVSRVTLSPTSVTGGSNSTGTVTLNGAAPAGAAAVALASSNTTAAQVPSSVVVAAGSTSTTFTVTTSAVVTVNTANITATYGGNASAVLTVNPTASVSAVSLNPTSVVGGNNSTGTVRLNVAAPTGGASVTLASSNTTGATVPGSVTVPAGSTSATFTVTTPGVSATATSVISATLGGTASATVTVTAASLSSVSRSPSSVVGGSNSTGTVTLNGAAPSAGAVVTLSSSNTSAAQVPASVTIAAGSRSATFTITTTPVASNTSVTISGTYGVTRTNTLTVNAPTLSSITRSPTSVVGGNNSTGTVTLSGPTPSGGAVVTLSSSNTSAAQVPASVTIAAGARTATFTITTSGVASSTSVTLSASYGATRTTTLTVSVASLTSLTLNPSTVTGGNPSTGTLTLNAAAPPSGAVVSLTSSNTSAAQVPSTVTIPAGAKSVTVTVTTGAVHGTSSTIGSTYRSTTRSATLTVQ